MTVLLLTGFLTTILLRVLKNDFLKYTRDDEMGEAEEETGWKYLHGDVFRWAGRLQGVTHTDKGLHRRCLDGFAILLRWANSVEHEHRYGWQP